MPEPLVPDPLVQREANPPPTPAAEPREAPPLVPPPNIAQADAGTNNDNATPPQVIPFPTRLWRKALVTLGYAGPTRRARRERRELVQYIVGVLVCIAQVAVIVAFTAVAEVRQSPAPQEPGQSELAACTIIGAWNLIWLAWILLKCYLDTWILFEKRRIRRARLLARPQAVPHDGPEPQGAAVPPAAAPEAAEGRADAVNAPPRGSRLFHILLYKLSPFVSIAWWFSTILVLYTHGPRCRVSAIDVVIPAATVLVLTYVCFVTRAVMRTVERVRLRRRLAKPEVAKLPRRDVDRIPLVLYIPPPPDAEEGITTFPRALSYPPAPQPPPAKKPRRRFMFFRPRRRAHDVERDAGADAGAVDERDEWERTFEPGPYPFVRLPENRATCIVCMCDFEAPPRVPGWGGGVAQSTHTSGIGEDVLGDEEEDKEGEEERSREERIQVESLSPAGGDQGTGGEAPEPLRLLTCGHVYHKDCVDQWLTEKSGRCPYCSAPVVLPPAPPHRRWKWGSS